MLASFPSGTPLGIVAPIDFGFADIVRARADPATLLIDLVGEDLPNHPALPALDNVLVEGLDFVADPIHLLRSLHATAVSARLFGLVANAAHFGALAAFFRGERLARAHPLVYEELEPLLRDGGWRTLAINPLPDASIPESCTTPVRVQTTPLGFEIEDQAMLDRGRVAAFVAIADRG